jgi:hypothetical protein
MSKRIALALCATVFVCWANCFRLAFAEIDSNLRDYHTYTDSTGRAMEARVLRLDGDRVTIQRRDGRQFTVPVATFSPADQEFLRGEPSLKASIVATPDVVNAGSGNWEHPWAPDLRNPGKQIQLTSSQRIDVVILGDGYLTSERSLFEEDVQNWYARFLTFPVWREFRGAFRVRGLWIPSEERASTNRKSHFAVGVKDRMVSDPKSKETESAIFEALERMDVNWDASNKRYTHLVAMVLLKDEAGRNPSGITVSLFSPEKTLLRVGEGADSLHEFGHAFGGLRDEYIKTADEQANGKTPDRLSLLTVSNLCYSEKLRLLPWSHLVPGSAVNPDSTSVIGVLWQGGVAEKGVWHSEARCFMNGSHENWDLGKTRRGASLRDAGRFCFWCEEILVAKTLQRTGQLGDTQDGEALWKNWERLRPAYQQAFDVPARIAAENHKNAEAKFSSSPLFERPQ